jgi:hypothetical protein
VAPMLLQAEGVDGAEGADAWCGVEHDEQWSSQ